jgi:peptidoglycan/xylan/chitin deacetylase (PgdA/CDA1 family)
MLYRFYGEFYYMRILNKIVAFVLIVLVLTGAFYVFYMRPRYTVPVLMYHSIAIDKQSSLSVTPENFKKQMEYLNKAGYSVLSLDELVKGIVKGERFSGKQVVLTFDDGFRDNYIEAFPILSKYDMPAAIFLTTDYIGKKQEYLTWDQIRVMAKNNIDFGGHTRSHVYLPSIKGTELVMYEIAGCKADIEAETGKPAYYFCYPTGGFNQDIKQAVRIAGYKGACTTNRGFDKFNLDVYEINRIKITDSDMRKPFHFKAKLSGYYNLFRKGKSPD